MQRLNKWNMVFRVESKLNVSHKRQKAQLAVGKEAFLIPVAIRKRWRGSKNSNACKLLGFPRMSSGRNLELIWTNFIYTNEEPALHTARFKLATSSLARQNLVHCATSITLVFERRKWTTKRIWISIHVQALADNVLINLFHQIHISSACLMMEHPSFVTTLPCTPRLASGTTSTSLAGTRPPGARDDELTWCTSSGTEPRTTELHVHNAVFF